MTRRPPSAGSGSAADEFARLVEIMRVLRSPDGCPWDRKQSLESLKPFVLEEAHEVVDAIERGDTPGLLGEIGDLVFEGVFLAQLCAEEGRFDIAASLREVNEKLIRRHPHVFVQPDSEEAPSSIETPDEVLAQWERIKARERSAAGRERSGALDGIPRSMPALLAAHEIGLRAAAVWFDWATPEDVVSKIEEEVAEVRQALQLGNADEVAEEIGDLFFGLANLARKLGVEPEAALRAANKKFGQRFRRMEEVAEEDGRDLSELSLDDLESLWRRIKDEQGRSRRP